MRKFLAVLKREYKKVVFTWTFLITTFLMPVIAACFVVVPAFIFSMDGDQTRLVIADKNGNISKRLKENLSPQKIAEKAKSSANESLEEQFSSTQEEQIRRSAKQIGGKFGFVNFDVSNKSAEDIKKELNAQVKEKKIDAYLIIPEDINSKDSKFEFFSRKAGDFIINLALKDALNESVRSQRLADSDISEDKLKALSQKVELTTKSLSDTGEEKGDDSSPWAAFIVAMLIYIVLAIYGQAIMAAIVEEKETKISEVLFSSARPFELLMGKLVGVGLAGLTQLAMWILSLLILATFGVASMVASGMDVSLPNITALMIFYFFLFFLLGYFIYATIYALIGSMVSNMQEGGQFALPPIMLLLVGLYFCFAVVRDPNSTFAFWVSIAPFFAPIVMPVRILAEIPPFWQIALAVVLNLITIIGLTWVASRVYRVGMLMYGKRATIPEVWKWIKQS